MNKVPHDPKEIISVVDDDNKPIGETTRGEAHSKGLLHREVFVYLINSKKQVLLQKRTDTLQWDHSVGGHFPSKESYEQGALREIEEELGPKLRRSDLKDVAEERITSKPGKLKNYRFARVYLVKKDIPNEDFNIDKGEIAEIKWFSAEELKKLFLKPEQITRTAKYLLEKYIIEEIR